MNRSHSLGRSIAVVSTAFALVAWSCPARADELHDKAVSSFQEGRRWLEAGNCDAAITKLRESLAFESSVGARLSLAECLEKTDPLGAWRQLKEASSLAFLNHDERIGVADQRSAVLERVLPTIKFVLPPNVAEQAGFELRIDGELVDRFYLRSGVVAVKPGRHVLEATEPLRRWKESVTTEPGAQVQATVRLERDACAASTPTAPAATSSGDAPGSTRRTLGLAIAGVGVAGLVSGVVFGVLTLDKKSTIQNLCGGNAGACGAPPGSVDAERESAKTTAAISTASFIAGGAALVGGGVLFFTAPAQATGGVQITPRVASNGGGLGLSGAW